MDEEDEKEVFPAPAGMNRNAPLRQGQNMRVPRTRGDEPIDHAPASMLVVCSPHPRG